jgi:EutQ-like cupin domain
MTQPASNGEPGSRAPELVARQPLLASDDAYPRMRSRWIVAPDPAGWTGFVLSEWELTAAGWSDLHPHDETNVVVEGELYVESAGTTVLIGPGDSVRVAAGTVGTYLAPHYARMIGVYGPNPTGATSSYLDYWVIEDGDEHSGPEHRTNEGRSHG